eukprot:g1701.t1
MYNSISCADSGTTLVRRGYRDPKSELHIVDQGPKKSLAAAAGDTARYSTTFNPNMPRIKSEHGPDGLRFRNAGPGTTAIVGPSTYDVNRGLKASGALGISIKDGCRENAAFRPVHKPRDFTKLAEPSIQLQLETRLQPKPSFAAGVRFQARSYADSFNSKTARLDEGQRRAEAGLKEGGGTTEAGGNSEGEATTKAEAKSAGEGKGEAESKTKPKAKIKTEGQDASVPEGTGSGSTSGGVQEYGEDSLVAGKQPKGSGQRKKRGAADREWETLTDTTVLRNPPHDRDMLGGTCDSGKQMCLVTHMAKSSLNYGTCFKGSERFKETRVESPTVDAGGSVSAGSSFSSISSRASGPPPPSFKEREAKKRSSMFRSAYGHQPLEENAFWQGHHR